MLGRCCPSERVDGDVQQLALLPGDDRPHRYDGMTYNILLLTIPYCLLLTIPYLLAYYIYICVILHNCLLYCSYDTYHALLRSTIRVFSVYKILLTLTAYCLLLTY